MRVIDGSVVVGSRKGARTGAIGGTAREKQLNNGSSRSFSKEDGLHALGFRLDGDEEEGKVRRSQVRFAARFWP